MSCISVNDVLKYELERLRFWLNVEGGLSQTNEEACKLFYVLVQLVKSNPELGKCFVDITEDEAFNKGLLLYLMPKCPEGKEMMKLP